MLHIYDIYDRNIPLQFTLNVLRDVFNQVNGIIIKSKTSFQLTLLVKQFSVPIVKAKCLAQSRCMSSVAPGQHRETISLC